MKNKLIVLAFAILLGMAQAQTETVKLDKFVVTASPTGELQFSQTAGRSALGDYSSVLNTPRSVSSIDPEFLSDFNIDSITKIANYTSNVQSVGSFGQSATVNVRGDLAETYINSQRRTNNSFGYRPSFNSVESLDVVHGAASVVFGPGFYSGGYVNLITKQASSVSFTNVDVQLNTLNEYGRKDIFKNYTATIDTNEQIAKNIALRISYEVTEGTDHDLFVTYNHSSPEQSLTVNFEYSKQNTPEKIGVNRVTQQLISEGLYRSGTIINQLDTSEMPNGPLVKLDRLALTMSENDYGKAEVVFGQVIYTNRISDSVTLHELLLMEQVNRQRFASYEYLEFVRQTTIDNRTELHFDKNNLYTIVGINARYEYRNAQLNYFNTFFNAWDISKGGAGDASLFPEYFHGTIGMGGKEFFGPLDGLYDTAKSKLWTTSAFVQQRYKVGKFQFLYGLRADNYEAKVVDPLSNELEDTLNTTSNGYTTSLIYNINPKLSIYGTYGHLEAVNASVTGGAIVFSPDNKISEKNFHSLNRLYEVGLRYEGEGNLLSVTGFWQYRQQHNFYVSAPDDIMVRGIELENKYKLTKRVSLITNLTYMESNLDNSFPFEFNGIGLAAITEAGDYRIPGLSRIYANETVSYRIDKNWSIGASARWQSEQTGNALGGYVIPSQFSINGQIVYNTPKWSVRVAVYNLTDEDNWVHNGDFFGDNVVISRELPINGELSITRRF